MKAVPLSTAEARRIWIAAQKLDQREPFGAGAEATRAAVEHLGYVQIDTINVIERCHHHILFNRIPRYRRADLAQAQSADKSVFEYWTHALAYVPTRDFRFYLPEMLKHRREPNRWNTQASHEDYLRVIRTIRKDGAITIRDFEDETLVEKNHPWASRKPAKAALQRAFWDGVLTISARQGMVKSYELTQRHFGWDPIPKPATGRQVSDFLLERAVRSQGVVSLDSVCFLAPRRKPDTLAAIERKVRRKELRPVTLEGAGKTQHWVSPQWLDAPPSPPELTHILSPFDPLIIQRKRTAMIFGYEHVFEAYVPREKRRYGYFTLPVLVGDEIVAGLDLKTDRSAGKLLVQSWHWMGNGDATHRPAVQAELDRFERFQLGTVDEVAAG
jgi:uncharacterized protein YcaQ